MKTREIWYTIQGSRQDADGWNEISSSTYYSAADAQTALEAAQEFQNDGRLPRYELRVVRKTLIEEVVEPLKGKILEIPKGRAGRSSGLRCCLD
jgi:hypothetical protein